MILGLTGLKQSGKTSAARYLEREYGFEIMSFADPLKEAAQIIFRLTPKDVYEDKSRELPEWDGMTSREILQKLGTEVGRKIYEDVWVKNLKLRLEESNCDHIVIDDVRFPNEADMIQSKGGSIVGIERSSNQNTDLHKSETQIKRVMWDQANIIIQSNASLDHLYAMMSEVVDGNL